MGYPGIVSRHWVTAPNKLQLGVVLLVAFILGNLVLPILLVQVVLHTGLSQVMTSVHPLLGDPLLLSQGFSLLSWAAVLTVLWSIFGQAFSWQHLGRVMGLTGWQYPWFVAKNTIRVVVAMLLWATAVTVTAPIMLSLIGWEAPVVTQAAYPEAMVANPWVTILVAVLLSPLIEEVVFRGLLQGVLARRFSLWVSIGVPVFLFVVCHPHFLGHPMALLSITGLGLILGIVRHRSGSILPGLFGHSINNMAAAWLLFGVS